MHIEYKRIAFVSEIIYYCATIMYMQQDDSYDFPNILSPFYFIFWIINVNSFYITRTAGTVVDFLEG